MPVSGTIIYIIGFTMTKPSQFLINTDYLTIAQTGSSTYTVNISADTLVAGSNTVQNFDFTTTTQSGTLDRVFVKKGNDEYIYGAKLALNPATDVTGYLQVFRTSATNLRAQFVLENTSASSVTYPAMDFTLKVVSFKLPNML